MIAEAVASAEDEEATVEVAEASVVDAVVLEATVEDAVDSVAIVAVVDSGEFGWTDSQHPLLIDNVIAFQNNI